MLSIGGLLSQDIVFAGVGKGCFASFLTKGCFGTASLWYHLIMIELSEQEFDEHKLFIVLCQIASLYSLIGSNFWRLKSKTS